MVPMGSFTSVSISLSFTLQEWCSGYEDISTPHDVHRDYLTDSNLAFVDSLFLCYSALTVTGLSTVNLSSITPFQQAILFILMVFGNVVCANTFLTMHPSLICVYMTGGDCMGHGPHSSTLLRSTPHSET